MTIRGKKAASLKYSARLTRRENRKKGTVIIMALFTIADTHLSGGVKKPMDIFGERWRNWTERLIVNWRKTVSEEDTVVLPGDISWGMTLEEAEPDLKLLDSLPGQKLIGRGNHDYWWSTAAKTEAFFADKNIRSIKLLQNNAYFAQGRIIIGSRGWYIDEKTSPKDTDYKKIVAREAGRLELGIRAADKLGVGAEKTAFLHFPPVFSDFICREIVDVLKGGGVRECYYGHIHGKYDIPASAEFEGIRFTLISADFLNFVPYKII